MLKGGRRKRQAEEARLKAEQEAKAEESGAPPTLSRSALRRRPKKAPAEEARLKAEQERLAKEAEESAEGSSPQSRAGAPCQGGQRKLLRKPQMPSRSALRRRPKKSAVEEARLKAEQEPQEAEDESVEEARLRTEQERLAKEAESNGEVNLKKSLPEANQAVPPCPKTGMQC